MQNTNREQEIIDYLPLVHKIARTVKINNKDYDEDDLISIGVIGLMDALEKYDQSLEVPFKNYAYIRIKGAIIDEVRKTSRVPRSRMMKLNQYYRTKEELEKKFNRIVTEKEICAQLNLGKRELEGIHETISQLANVSLNEVLSIDSDSQSTLMEVTEDKNAVQIEEAIISGEQSEFLSKAIAQLSEREQQILQFIYVEELGGAEIAYIYGISKARISQLHGRALLKLRTIMERGYMDD